VPAVAAGAFEIDGHLPALAAEEKPVPVDDGRDQGFVHPIEIAGFDRVLEAGERRPGSQGITFDWSAPLSVLALPPVPHAEGGGGSSGVGASPADRRNGRGSRESRPDRRGQGAIPEVRQEVPTLTRPSEACTVPGSSRSPWSVRCRKPANTAGHGWPLLKTEGGHFAQPRAAVHRGAPAVPEA
jgi:hypothetical protein